MQSVQQGEDMQVRVDERGKVIAQGMDTVLSLLKEIRESQQTSKCESCHTLELKLRICRGNKEGAEKRVAELEELLDRTATVLAGMHGQANSIVWRYNAVRAEDYRIQSDMINLRQTAYETNVMIRNVLGMDDAPRVDTPLD